MSDAREKALQTLKDKRRWYERGLAFRCKHPACDRCCSGAKGPGYVWLNVDEMRAIAAHMGQPFELFTRHFVRQIDHAYSLIEKRNHDCIFLEGGACSIYEVRPTQCRTYPFWPEPLKSPESWQAEARECPGIEDAAPVVPGADVEYQRTLDEAARAEYDNWP
jgi:Fe-S-cluster containining protein